MTPVKRSAKANAALDAQYAVFTNELKHISEWQENFEAKFDQTISKLVSKEEFNPVRDIVYGAVRIVLVAVIGALLALVIAANLPQAL